MADSITINNVTYDFIITDNLKDAIFGSGQNCHECDINLMDNDSKYFCKICSVLNTMRIAKTKIIRQEHYFKKRN